MRICFTVPNYVEPAILSALITTALLVIWDVVERAMSKKAAVEDI